jgi:SNF2 family DNA or RNA helicase
VQPSDSGAIFFWAETSDAPQPARLNLRQQTARPHPFAAPLKAVYAVLGRHPTADRAFKPGEIVLRLPSARYGPLPSPPLVHEWDLSGAGEPVLAAWRIPACAASPADALELLQQLSGDTLPAHVHVGDDLRYWQVVFHLALETLAQQKVLPSLLVDDKAKRAPIAYAQWTPVLDGPRDGPRLAQLRRAMPAVCRAQAGKEHPSASSASQQGSSSHQLLDSFLQETIDAFARRWGRGLPGSIAASKDTAAAGATPEQDWLYALLRSDASIHGSQAQIQRLAKSYQAWLRSLRAAGDEHFRVAFRLEAPPSGEPAGRSARPGQWMLHYLLQSREDPSLLVPAAQLWRKGTTKPAIDRALDRRLRNPQELLLTGLGFTARFFEPLSRSLHQKQPSAAALSVHEAYDFLRETAPLLEESGFGVLIPPWWNQPGMRLGARLRMRGKQAANGEGVASGLVSLENLINYQWEISLGGEAMSRQEFEALVALKAPLVQIRGQWVQLNPDQIDAAIRFWEKMDQQGEAGLLDALHIGLEAEQIDGLPIEGVEYEGWLQEWMERFTRRDELALQPVPQGLHAQLRPYQHYGYSWLAFQRRWGIGACLADDMGLGKTVQALTLLLRLREEWKAESGQDRLPGPVLLVCPTSVVINWAKEAARFAPDLALLVHQGIDRLQGESLIEEAQRADMVVTSYALVRRDGETLQEIDWHGVILDEAQNIKNAETKQARMIRRLASGFRFALTGTPVENRLAELWSIMHFLNPGFLGSRERFRQRFAIPIERYNDAAAAQHLRRLTAPFILRRVKTDPTVIQDLPDKQETKAYCTLTEEQATLYEAVVQDALRSIAEAGEMERRGLVLSMLMKLKQICNHPAQFLHQIGDGYLPNGDEKRSGKLARAVELLDELLAAGDRTLVFTQFAEMGQLLRAFFQHRFGVPVLFLHGGTPARQRNQMVERFQDETDGPPIFILSLKAGGTGLNLTRASHVLHFDRWWNPAVEDQATDRAFRIGQKRNVQVHKFVCTGTLEEKIDAMIESKKALADSIVGRGENWLTELSTSDLHDLVALRREMLE